MLVLRRGFSYLRNNFLACVMSLVMISISLFMIVAQLTYDASDNSLFNFTDAENGVNNLLGIWGAYFAGAFLQAFGCCFILPASLFFITAVKMHLGRNAAYKTKSAKALKSNTKNNSQNIMMRLSLTFFCIMPLSVLLTFIPYDGLEIKSAGGYLGIFLKNEMQNYLQDDIIIFICAGAFLSTVFYSVNITVFELIRAVKIAFKLVLIALLYLFALAQLTAQSIKNLVAKFRQEEGHNSDAFDTVEESAIHASKNQRTTLEEVEANTDRTTSSVISKLKAVKEKVIAETNKGSRSLNLQPKFVFDSEDFNLPSTSLLSQLPAQSDNKLSNSMLEQSSRLLANVLSDFGIKGEIINVSQGPVVTLYELEPAAGTKSSRVIGLSDDIARSMSAISARISVIPGKNAIGIELPNVKRKIVYLRELLESHEYVSNGYRLPLVLGHNISGRPIIVDLAKMPHLLVAGTTGSGKSVAINTMILSLLFKHSPQQCKFIMIDPKMLELSVYDNIPHLLAPVVTEPRKAVAALKWVVQEMESRYRAMANIGVRNIKGYNETMHKAEQEGRTLTKKIQTGFDSETSQPIYETVELDTKQLPFIVVIVDEMADLMLVAGKDIETSIQRLAQMARAAGIHLIMATQRPSVDVITGVIKANFPTRISFQVTSKIDSRTILGEQGAEQLLGMGDMLYMSGGGKIERVHGPFVSDSEVESIVNYLKKQSVPEYVNEVTKVDSEEDSGAGVGISTNMSFTDAYGNVEDTGQAGDLYSQAVKIVTESKRASISYVQRALRIGYNRAANLIEQMEKDGIVSSPNHQGKREVLEEE